ncbi:hypothetical protein COO60DRAFT_1224774 [Scenedesmus sp. NREL 46B-D3]|nr:hypothetical protein COO60DRAFT_1224774 [Scenedesmus sp. NREL 46B-D3]
MIVCKHACCQSGSEQVLLVLGDLAGLHVSMLGLIQYLYQAIQMPLITARTAEISWFGSGSLWCAAVLQHCGCMHLLLLLLTDCARLWQHVWAIQGTALITTTIFVAANSTSGCPCCGAEVESLSHFMFDCPATSAQRDSMFAEIRFLPGCAEKLRSVLSMADSSIKVLRFVSDDIWGKFWKMSDGVTVYCCFSCKVLGCAQCMQTFWSSAPSSFRPGGAPGRWR